MKELQAVKKAWLIGAVVILLIVAGDIAARRAGMGGSDWMLYTVWGAFATAVFITTYLAPRHKLIVGMSHTVTISLLFAFSNWIQSQMGMASDKGFGTIFALIYISSFIPALFATAGGMLLSARKEKETQ